MSVINATPLLAAAGGDYQISRSVRLRSSASAYLNRTFSSGANETTSTLSLWVKRGKIGAQQTLMGVAGGGSNEADLFFDGGDTLTFASWNGGSRPLGIITTSAVYRDPSAWYHIVFVVNTTTATANDRLVLYVNGVRQALSVNTQPSQNAVWYWNGAYAHRLGAYANTLGVYLDGYLTDINFIDGQALTPSSFGETDSITGVWKPKKYAGTYGTNGFYLNFSDNSSNTATTIGKDYSGNGNNWTPNNISVTAGVTYDSMLDVPTLYADGGNGRGNYCVLNAAIRPYPVADNIADGNLKFTSSSASVSGSAWSTIPITTSKWYAECTVTTASASSADFIGVSNDLNFAALGTYASALRDYGYTYKANGNKCNNSSTGTAYGASYTSGDVIGIALDAGAGTIEFFKNGTSQGTAYTGMTYNGGFLFGSTAFNGGVHNWNFGQRPFSYTPPTGFKALNTQNLPEPTIKKGNQYFDVSLWTGDQAARTITNSGSFQPDLIWTKSRSDAESHRLHDAVRGGNGSVLYELNSNLTEAEGTDTLVSGFAPNGFTIASGANTPNITGRTYAAWQWKESPSAGFDIVTYTGTGAAQTVAHNLGVAPRFIIAKRRNAAVNWFVGSGALPSWSYALEGLNTTAAANSGATAVWNATAPTSSVFSVGSDLSASGGTYVAYLFAEVAGFSKAFSYTGNGSADGPFIFCGFRPRYVMIKRTDSTGDWFVFDTARNTFNTMSSFLRPNWSDAEATNTNHSIDLLSNGFKSRAVDTGVNASGGTYIGFAFAESPFKNSLAR